MLGWLISLVVLTAELLGSEEAPLDVEKGRVVSVVLPGKGTKRCGTKRHCWAFCYEALEEIRRQTTARLRSFCGTPQ